LDLGRWVRAVRADEIPPGQGKPVAVEDRMIALYNDGGAFFAIDDTCPHQGASLGEGTLHEGRVICPWHNFVFELSTGYCRGIPQSNVASYPTRRSGDDVEIELPDGTGQERE
jgi:nitrite reductase (NADH) small subunit/3-phenylpropionate/trans-cinnamate dioxygenase ferredoxin subunit